MADGGEMVFDSVSDKLLVNTDDDAAYEMTLIVKGDDVLVSDILFGA